MGHGELFIVGWPLPDVKDILNLLLSIAFLLNATWVDRLMNSFGIIQESLYKNHMNGRSGLHLNPKSTLVFVSSLGCHLEMTLQ